MSTPDPGTGYAYWISPDGSAKVVYSLTLFHEIDALVNDGYRRIPHGGVEVAGLLLGSLNGDLLRLEAFRPIECSHAYGPSFILSEQDLQQLREQIDATASDRELEGLTVVGWFVGHTRSPLRMSDREAGWFDELFPGPGNVAVLVKPEHFQPTQFGFLLRDSNAGLERDASNRAVILPLSGRAGRVMEEPVQSIPAPQEVPPSQPEELPRQQLPVRPATGEATRVRSSQAQPPSPPPELYPAAPTQPEFPPVLPRAEISSTPVSRAAPTAPAGVPYIPERVVTREVVTPDTPLGMPPRRRPGGVRQENRELGWRFAAVLLLAAVLGCVAGYLAYLRLPSPVIALAAREQQTNLVISWPASQTEDVDYATIRVNDGQRRILSLQEKEAGQAVVSAPPGNVKVEVTAKHWLRDARGILRLVRRTASALPSGNAPPPISQVPYR